MEVSHSPPLWGGPVISAAPIVPSTSPVGPSLKNALTPKTVMTTTPWPVWQSVLRALHCNWTRFNAHHSVEKCHSYNQGVTRGVADCTHWRMWASKFTVSAPSCWMVKQAGSSFSLFRYWAAGGCSHSVQICAPHHSNSHGWFCEFHSRFFFFLNEDTSTKRCSYNTSLQFLGMKSFAWILTPYFCKKAPWSSSNKTCHLFWYTVDYYINLNERWAEPWTKPEKPIHVISCVHHNVLFTNTTSSWLVQQPFTVVKTRCTSHMVSFDIQPSLASVGLWVMNDRVEGLRNLSCHTSLSLSTLCPSLYVILCFLSAVFIISASSVFGTFAFLCVVSKRANRDRNRETTKRQQRYTGCTVYSTRTRALHSPSSVCLMFASSITISSLCG